MYIRKQTQKRYLTPVRGKKQKARKIKKIILLILILGFIGGGYYAVKNAKAVASYFNRPSWTEWHLGKVRITGVGKDAAYEVSKYITFGRGQSVTHRDCVNLENNIMQNMRQFDSVRVCRNFINKELSIKIKKHVKIAKVNTEYKMLYLAQKGELFADKDSTQDSALLNITLKGKIKSEFLPQEFVELIKELNAVKKYQFEEVVLDLDNETFALKTQQQISAEMGAVKDFKQKLKTLFTVVETAQARNLKTPYDINLKYFEDGKIYLTPTL